MKCQVVFTIDEEILRDIISDDDGDDELSLEELIESECGWLDQSGFSVEEVRLISGENSDSEN